MAAPCLYYDVYDFGSISYMPKLSVILNRIHIFFNSSTRKQLDVFFLTFNLVILRLVGWPIFKFDRYFHYLRRTLVDNYNIKCSLAGC